MLKSRSPIEILILLLVTGIPVFAGAQNGAVKTNRNLAELTSESTLIVHGYIVSARVEPHPQFANLTTVLVFVAVEDTLKGAAAKQFQFRQYVWDPRDERTAAGYAKGQEVLLMLGRESRYRLRSPVGLDQGRFRVIRDESGLTLAINGKGNAGLFSGVNASASAQGTELTVRQAGLARTAKSGGVGLADLKDIIRTLANRKVTQ